MNYFRVIIVSLLLTMLHSPCYSQEEDSSEPFKRHRIGVMIGHTHIPLGFLPNIDQGFVIVPTWGLAYDFGISKHWSIGLHSELEIANYVIEQAGGATLERENPLIIALAVGYNPWKSLIIEAGFGREIEKNESFWIYRVGMGYEIEIGKGWDLAPAMFIDIKEDIYTSLTFGLQIGRSF